MASGRFRHLISFWETAGNKKTTRISESRSADSKGTKQGMPDNDGNFRQWSSALKTMKTASRTLKGGRGGWLQERGENRGADRNEGQRGRCPSRAVGVWEGCGWVVERVGQGGWPVVWRNRRKILKTARARQARVCAPLVVFSERPSYEPRQRTWEEAFLWASSMREEGARSARWKRKEMGCGGGGVGLKSHGAIWGRGREVTRKSREPLRGLGSRLGGGKESTRMFRMPLRGLE